MRKRSLRKSGAAAMALCFLLLVPACSTDEQPAGTPTPSWTGTPRPTATSTPTSTPEPYLGGDCDAIAERIPMDSRVARSVQGGAYPDTCEVYCLWVPAGSLLEIGISDFDVDLDIYVDVDLSVLEYDDHGTWVSNYYGSRDELVTIADPDGRYYLQVCSFDNVPSDFVLYSEFTP